MENQVTSIHLLILPHFIITVFGRFKKLKLEGFDVRGSIGWTTRERIKLDFLWDLYDVIAWYIPQIAGNIIGIKYIYGRTRFK